MPLTAAEALAATLTAVAAATLIFTYLCDLVGVPFTPAVVAPFTTAATIAAAWHLRPTRHEGRGGASAVVSVLLVVGGLFAWLLYLAAPSGLPIGGGDLTHHLQLIDYLERHWRLVHAPATVEPYLGEMVHYTPGVHVLAALVGQWSGRDGVHVVHAVVAGSLAIKAGFVVLIAQRVLVAHPLRVPLAVASAVALLLPYPYVLDAFLRDSFLAQVMSECFAVAMWWALVAWDDAADATPAAWPMACFGLFACGAFLTWPIWIGPPCVALLCVVVARRHLPIAARLRHAVLALLPLGVIGGIYLAGRTAQLGMSGAAGAVMHPSVHAYSGALLALAAVGLALGIAALVTPHAGAPRVRATVLLLAGIGLQAAALFVQAAAIGNESAYMAYKTLYLTPYPMAVLAALPLARLGDRARRFAIGGLATDQTRRGGRGLRRHLHALAASAPLFAAWTLVAALGLHAAVRLRAVRRPPPALTDAMLEAGAWAREHLPRGCIAYMVPDDDTSYWLHLAVLRNPRMSARSADLATYSMGQTIVRWFSPGDGLPYAIADLTALSRDVREDLDVIASFDSAAVVKRRGPSACPDEQLPPAP